MTNSAAEDRQISSRSKNIVLAILCALLVGGLAITNQSLWIDEASSAAKAGQNSLASWWTKLVAEKGSDLQMPFYMLYLWAWCKAFGTSEIALRAANLPWFAAGVWALLWGFAGKWRLQLAITVLTLIHAFLWYYISEARPYIVLFAFSAMSAACLFRLHENRNRSIESTLWFRLFCFGIVGICAANLIAVPWAMAALCAFIFWIGPRAALRTATRFAWSSGLLIITLGTLGLYYLWTLQLGARASDVGRTGFANLVFVFYELLGISGLGPGRLILREEGMHSFSAYALPVSIGVIAVFSLLAAAVVELRRKATRRDFGFFGITVGFPAVTSMLFGVAAHMRLLGRHFTPLLPFLLVLMAIGLQQMLFASRNWIRAIAVWVIAVLLLSALEIRFAPRHQRDDYRHAAAQAHVALDRGKTVWWLADETAGHYYGLTFGSEKLLSSLRVFAADLEFVKEPDFVFLSKPDIYDPGEKARRHLERRHFRIAQRLMGFQVLEKPNTRFE